MLVLRTVGLVALLMLVSSSPAVAQDEGVFIDPDSPSAKEYAIPLEAERRQADPGQQPGAATVQGERSSPLFGAGIASTPEQGVAGAPDSRTPPAEERDGTSSSESDEQTPGPADGERPDDPTVLESAISTPGAPQGGFNGPLAIGGVALGVLALGAVIGLLLRRRQSA